MTKIVKSKDINMVFAYFRYKTGTSLDCAKTTGILRNSITWYIRDLRAMGVLVSVGKYKDRFTGRWANYYSADPDIVKQKGGKK